MKIEIEEKRPDNFKEYWHGQYYIFSHFEYVCGIPSVMFAITILKENGKPNVNFSGRFYRKKGVNLCKGQ